jgi:hypothetical protein
MWLEGKPSDEGNDEEEDMRKRENELKQELNMATLRCDELKRTLIETRSFIDPLHMSSVKKSPSKEGAYKGERRSSGMQKPTVDTVMSAENEDDEDEDEEDDDEEDVSDYNDKNDNSQDDEPSGRKERSDSNSSNR